MQFVTPMDWDELLEKLGSQSVVGSTLKSHEWSQVPGGLRENAFFSATIEDVRILQSMKDAIGDFLSNAIETLPDGSQPLKMGSRAQFVKEMSDFAQSHGLGPLDPDLAGTMQDIRSQTRLSLIFNIKTQQMYSYANWEQGQDPDLLDAFPAQRFIRVQEVKVKRIPHQLNEGVVKLKTDLPFWLSMNDPSFGGFGVPWGPWGFNSGMGEEDVDRPEAERTGLLKPGEPVHPIAKQVNDNLQASTEGLDDDMVAHLRNTFGDQVEFDDNSVKWKGTNNANQDDSSSRPNNDASDDLTRRIGADVRAIFEGFRSRDNGEPLSPEDALSAGASISAVATGRKPLYHEAWGQDISSDLIRRLWGLRLPEVKMLLEDAHLYVYSPASVEAVIAANPDAYPGVDLLDKIRRSVMEDSDGDLLGYGAPTRFGRDRVKVQIVDAAGTAVFGFYSIRANADRFGFERALDFSLAYGQDYGYEIIP